jgi:protein arginine N-methyltransferase 2
MILSLLGKSDEMEVDEEEVEEEFEGQDQSDEAEVVEQQENVDKDEQEPQSAEKDANLTEEDDEYEYDAMSSSNNNSSKKAPNADYLAMKLTYSEGRLLDDEQNGVMMGWEAPLMERHAAVIAPTEGLDVLNVGFGLGLIDTYLQEKKPGSHTIIEAHPDVYAKMIADGWDKKEGVRILFGRWQDVVDQLETYDGIFFDTFGGK